MTDTQEQTADSDTVSSFDRSSKKLKAKAKNPLASCRSPTALKIPYWSKQCHCLQFAQSASLAFCMT